MSPYQFVGSNPITGRDPTGLYSLAELGVTAGISGVLGGFAYGLAGKFAGRSYIKGFLTGTIR